MTWWDEREQCLNTLFKSNIGKPITVREFEKCKAQHEKEIAELKDSLSKLKKQLQYFEINERCLKDTMEGMVKVEDVLKIVEKLHRGTIKNKSKVKREFNNGVQSCLDMIELDVKQLAQSKEVKQ